MANITGERETFMIRMFGLNESIEVISATINVADVPLKRNII